MPPHGGSVVESNCPHSIRYRIPPPHLHAHVLGKVAQRLKHSGIKVGEGAITRGKESLDGLLYPRLEPSYRARLRVRPCEH